MKKFYFSFKIDQSFNNIMDDYRTVKSQYDSITEESALGTIQTAYKAAVVAKNDAGKYIDTAQSDPTEVIDDMGYMIGELKTKIEAKGSDLWTNTIIPETAIRSTKTFNVVSTSGHTSPGNLTFYCVYKDTTNKILWFDNVPSNSYVPASNSTSTDFCITAFCNYRSTVTSTFNGCTVTIPNVDCLTLAEHNTILAQNGTSCTKCGAKDSIGATMNYWTKKTSSTVQVMNGATGQVATDFGIGNSSAMLLVEISEETFINALLA